MDIFLNNSLLFFVALAIGFAWLGQHFIKIPAFISFLMFAILLGFSNMVTLGASFNASIVSFALSFLLVDVAYETTHIKFNKEPARFAFHNSWLPFFTGGVVAYFGLGVVEYQKLWVYGSVFMLSALPLLALWLRKFNACKKDASFLLQSAAWTDLVAWSGLVLCIDPTRLPITVLGVFIGVWLIWLTRRQPWVVFLAVFVAVYTIFEHFKAHGLFWAIAAAWSRQKWSEQKDGWDSLTPLINWLAVPLVLIASLSGIGAVTTEFNALSLCLLVALPILAKLIASKWAVFYLKKDFGKLPAATLMNVRGLTELVFLEVAHRNGLIDTGDYGVLAVMALIATILPAIFLKKY